LKIPLDKILHKSYILKGCNPSTLNMKIAGKGFVRKICSVAAVVLALNWTACDNPFQTRTPEAPKRAQNTWVLPHSPGIVLVNLRNALAELNVVNYSRCFSDSFRFVAEALVDIRNPGKFVNWSAREERNYLEQMINPLPADSAFSLRLDSLQTINMGESVMYLQDYELVARHRRQSEGIPRRVSGTGRFMLRRNSFGDWSIYLWEDFAAGNAFTWSELKAAFVLPQ
jgi:hypothetical protein